MITNTSPLDQDHRITISNSNTNIVIEWFTFQPFKTRALKFPGDVVIGLRFTFNPDIVKIIKNGIATYGAAAIDPARLRAVAGGWLPNFKIWFVESLIWPAIKCDLVAAGFRVKEVSHAN